MIIVIKVLNAHYENLDREMASQLKDCTYGGYEDRLLAKRYVELKDKVTSTFNDCLNKTNDAKNCGVMSYKVNGLRPLNEKNPPDKIFMNVIINVEQCNGK